MHKKGKIVMVNQNIDVTLQAKVARKSVTIVKKSPEKV